MKGCKTPVAWLSDGGYSQQGTRPSMAETDRKMRNFSTDDFTLS